MFLCKPYTARVSKLGNQKYTTSKNIIEITLLKTTIILVLFINKSSIIVIITQVGNPCKKSYSVWAVNRYSAISTVVNRYSAILYMSYIHVVGGNNE